MNMPVITLFLCLIPLLALGGLGAARMIRRRARLTGALAVNTGARIAESSWNSASINGLGFSGCVKITRFEQGFEVRISPFFGGGRLWLPRDEVRVDENLQTRAFGPPFRGAATQEHSLRLYGQLGEFVAAGLRESSTTS